MAREQDNPGKRAERFSRGVDIGRRQSSGGHNQALRRHEAELRKKYSDPKEREAAIKRARAAGGGGGGGGSTSSPGGCAVAVLAFLSVPAAIVSAVAYHLSV